MNKGITAKLSTLALAICAIMAPSHEVQAAPIVYIFTATGSGATGTDSNGNGGTPFTDEALTFSVYADSDDIAFDAGPPSNYSLPASSATLQIGSTLTTLSDAVTIFSLPDQSGIGTTVDGDLYFLATSSSLAGYDLSAPFSPVSLTGLLSLTDTVLTTPLGWVYISDIDPNYTGTFEAALAVPEPSAMLMASLAAGTCLMTVVMRRRKEREVLAC